jgi:hypothetical protein
MQKTTCSQLRQKLSELKDLKKKFDLELEGNSLSKNFATEKAIKEEIEIKLKIIREALAPWEIKMKLGDWENFYERYFNQKLHFTTDMIPERTEQERREYTRLIVMIEGMTLKGTYEKCAEFFPVEKTFDFDTLESDNAIVTAYAIWVKDQHHADEELASLTPDDLLRDAIHTQTLHERLLHELKYFTESGSHLDDGYPETFTICGDSYFFDGKNVPRVNFQDGKLWIRSFFSSSIFFGCRGRRVLCKPGT